MPETYPYTCSDDRCTDRQSRGIRCPWCWGGFLKQMPTQEIARAEKVLRRAFGDVEEVTGG